VILSTDKYRQIAEVTVQTKHYKLVARCEATDMEMALRDALETIERQAIRQKKKFGTIKRHPKSDVKGAKADGAVPAMRKANVAVKVAAKSSVGRKAVPMLVHSFPSHSPLAEPHVVRSTDGVALRPMSVEEAVKEAAFRDRDVFVFRDHGGQAMVLHRKRDGKMELIEVP
jgi:putative sigma-54 modulation protein